MGKIGDDVISQIIRLYSDGNSISSIRKIVGISDPTISKILKNNGIIIRKTNYQKLNLDISKIQNMYDIGMSTYQIAKELNCSDETIRKLVKVRNIRTRNKLKEESIDKIRNSCRNKWLDQDYINKVKAKTSTEEYKRKLSVASKKYKTLSKWVRSKVGRSVISNRTTQLWNNPEFRAKQEVWYQSRGERLHNRISELKNDPQWFAKYKESLSKSSIARMIKYKTCRNISFTQQQLYYILDISGITHFEEGPDTSISNFYVVDCIIPIQQNMAKSLIIEVQGEYWHSLPNTIVRDKQKNTYIRKHTDYDLLYINELDLRSMDQVMSKLGQYGIELKYQSFTIKDVTLKRISESDAKLFYSVFHYSHSVRKGAITFGAYVGDYLIAAISYTYPLRENTAIRLGCKMSEVMEISRLARRIDIVCKNLPSFMIGKTRKMLPNTIRKLVSFSDSTYNHFGTIYKASGFILDGIVDNDYHYVSEANAKFHKKTIWDHSKRMKMSETEYAVKHNLSKVITGPKYRWLYDLHN